MSPSKIDLPAPGDKQGRAPTDRESGRVPRPPFARPFRLGRRIGTKGLGIFGETGSVSVGNVELVFRAGLGFDPAKMVAAVRGQVGAR